MPNPEGGNQFFSNSWMGSSSQNVAGSIVPPGGPAPWNVVSPAENPLPGQNLFGNVTPDILKNVPNIRQMPNGQWSDGEGNLYDPNSGKVFYSPGGAGYGGPGLYFGEVPKYQPTPGHPATMSTSPVPVAPVANVAYSTIPGQGDDPRSGGGIVPIGGTPLVTDPTVFTPDPTSGRSLASPTTTTDPNAGRALGTPAAPGSVTGVTGTPLVPGATRPSLTPGDEDSQFYVVSPQDPQLQENFFAWLKTNIGAGATPFPDNLNASRDPLLNALYNFYSTGQGDTPAAKTIMQLIQNPKATIPDIINQMAESGLPVDRTQAWQAMIAAQQRNIDRTAADLRGQFAFSGNLAGTPFANAMVDFYSQAAKDQNATLASWQANALEAARGRQMNAGELILNASERGQDRLTSLGMFLSNSARDLGTLFQGLGQQDIDRVLNEFIRTRPEYSPLLNLLFSAATTFPPTLQKRTGLGIGGALLSSLPILLSKLPNISLGGSKPSPKTPNTFPESVKPTRSDPIDVKLRWLIPSLATLIDGNFNRPLVDNLLAELGDIFSPQELTQVFETISFDPFRTSMTLEDLTAIMDGLWSTEYGAGSGGGGGDDSWWKWFIDNFWDEMG